MIDDPNTNWKPTPELLAAFADGELDARDDAAELRARIERWLAKNPQAEAELVGNRRLKAIFERTNPPTPSSETWRSVLERIHERPAVPEPQRTSAGAWLIGAGAAACLVWVVLLAGSFWRTPAESTEVLMVATDADVEIVHVEGNAIDSLVVGLLPLNGVLELANPGEVIITSVTPYRRDNMVPMVQIDASRRPMIWAKLEGEAE